MFSLKKLGGGREVVSRGEINRLMRAGGGRGFSSFFSIGGGGVWTKDGGGRGNEVEVRGRR